LWLSLRKDPLGANASPATPTDSLPSPTAYSTPILYRPNTGGNSGAESFPVFHRDQSSHHVNLNGVLESTKELDSIIDNGDLNEMEDDEGDTRNKDTNSSEMLRGSLVNNNNNNTSANKMIMGEEVLLVLHYEAGPLGIHVNVAGKY
jgi:hypothetical protein